MAECQGWWGKKFGHKFDHIFDVEKGEPTLSGYQSSRRGPGISGVDTSPGIMEILEASRPVKRIYVYSICRRCGHIIHRDGMS